MIHSPEIPTEKLIDYNALLLSLKDLRNQAIIIQKLQDEIRSINETVNHINWIGTEASKPIWNNFTKHKIQYLAILEEKLQLDLLKLAQKYS